MVHVIVKDIIDEVYQDYKKPSMLIACCQCDWKCLREQGLPIDICQNCKLNSQTSINMNNTQIVKRYIKNSITSAIIFAGLEPMLQFEEVVGLIHEFRKHTEDDVVIYTGYYKEEIKKEIESLRKYKNIIIKFGRFVPNQKEIHDSVLGVGLASDNQYAEKIS